MVFQLFLTCARISSFRVSVESFGVISGRLPYPVPRGVVVFGRVYDNFTGSVLWMRMFVLALSRAAKRYFSSLGK